MSADKSIIELQTKLGLPKSFFDSLLKEDDWSFVIKLHSLIESVTSSLLVYHFKDKRLESIFKRIELSNKSVGKIAFLKALGLLRESNRRYIVKLSELRNQIVHNVSHYNLSLQGYVSKLDKNQLKSFSLAFSPFESTLRKIDSIMPTVKSKQDDLSDYAKIDKMITRAKSNPKLHIWIGAYNLLVSISDSKGYSDFQNENLARDIMFNFEEE